MPSFRAWTVWITLRGPVSTASSTPRGMGIDVPFARNAEQKYYIPGTLVKGKLREALQELNSATGNAACPNLRALLGKDPIAEGDLGQERSLLYFGDFVAETEPRATIRYRIARDEELGAVKPNMNVMIESPFEPGGKFVFKGPVWAIADDPMAIEKQMQFGLAYVPAFGADLSTGFGQTIDVKVKSFRNFQGRWPTQLPNDSLIPIGLEPRGPLCVGGKRIAANIFESQTVLPGGVLKGVLAQMLIRLGGVTTRDVETAGPANGNFAALRREFSRIRFRHAHPVLVDDQATDLKRPVATPMSLVWTGEELRDAIWWQKPFLTQTGRAPAFQPDWKGEEWEAAVRITGEVQPPMELRVRTAIDGEAGIARDKSLFAYRVAAPKEKDVHGATHEYRWLTSIDLNGIADQTQQSAVATDLKTLLGEYGLAGVGKLKTHCKVHHQPWQPFECSSMQPVKQNHWIVTLQTPALLVAADQFQQPASEQEMRQKLEEYWTISSGQTLTLVDYFARWQLAGGEYIGHLQTRKSYQPYLLAEPGSVFLLRGEGAECVQRWLDGGLPVGPGPKLAFGLNGDPSDWRTCPYIPENGYGEIAVNQSLHQRLELTEADVDAL